MKREPGHDGSPATRPPTTLLASPAGGLLRLGAARVARGPARGGVVDGHVPRTVPRDGCGVGSGPDLLPVSDLQVSRSRPQSLSRSSVCAPEVTMCTTTSSAFGYASRDA